MIDDDLSPVTNEADCPRCAATTAAAKAEVGLVAKACIEQLGRVADSIIGLVREAHASEKVALYAWKAATDLSGDATTTASPATRTEWRLQFETDSRDTLVAGNERCKPTGDGRWEHTVTLPFREKEYREFAAKAEAKGADNVRLSKRVAVRTTTRGEWEDA